MVQIAFCAPAIEAYMEDPAKREKEIALCKVPSSYSVPPGMFLCSKEGPLPVTR